MRDVIDEGLAAAQAALSQGILAVSDGDSALSYYKAALALDAGNSVAVDRTKLVFDALLRQSREGIEKANFDGTELALNAATQIFPDSRVMAGLREEVPIASGRAAECAKNGAHLSELVTQAEQTAANTNDLEALQSAARLLA